MVLLSNSPIYFYLLETGLELTFIQFREVSLHHLFALSLVAGSQTLGHPKQFCYFPPLFSRLLLSLIMANPQALDKDHFSPFFFSVDLKRGVVSVSSLVFSVMFPDSD